ncbi:ABC transporter permease [Bacillus sp. 03113]|uniref:ABC transporter permease n=1 Tax=Bacillus sp. 03113 TaxID=2578211 RepID=UPI0011448B55|nr:ABC transporter permease [Bacillus sp. 03113]
MKGLLIYQSINYLRSYRYVPPLSIFIISLIVNYTFEPNPILDSYSYTSVVLFFVMGWFTVTVFHAEDEGLKQITLFHAKSSKDYHLALFLICVLIGLFLSAVSVAYPVVFDMFGGETRPLHIILGFMSHFSLSILSIALSALFTRDVVKNKRNTWWGVMSILVFSVALSTFKSLLLKGLIWILPPIRFSLEMMSSKDNMKSIPDFYYWQFGWIFLYGIVFIVLFFGVLKHRRTL